MDDGIIINSDWSYFLVAYLDILGQKDVFNNLCLIKPGDQIEDTLKKEISQNLHYIKTVRDNLRDFFLQYTSDEPSSICVNPAFQDQFNQARKAEIYFQFISDSLIAFVPLNFNNFFSIAVNGVLGVLGGCCQVMLGSLSTGHAIRGGIEICWGTRLESGEIYGPALNKAYCLESKIAKNPKIAIGEGAWNFLRSVYDRVPQHPKQIEKDIDGCQKIADHCLNLISDDIDGCRILDYLGPGFLDLNKDLPDFYQLYEGSKEFAISSYKKYARQGDTKLAEKYQYLTDYFQNRSAVTEKSRSGNSK